MTEPLPPSLFYTPYFAGLEGKSDADISVLEDRIDQLPESVRTFLFDETLPDRLAAEAARAGLPPEYALAFTKIVFMVIMGDVPVSAPRQLLERLGVPTTTASALARSLDEIFKPLVAARGTQKAQQGMHPLAPLTQHIVPTTPPGMPQGVSRNVVDLKNVPRP